MRKSPSGKASPKTDDFEATAHDLRARARRLTHGQHSGPRELGNDEVVHAIAAFVEVLGKANAATSRFTRALIFLAFTTVFVTVESVVLLVVQILDARHLARTEDAIAINSEFFNNANNLAVVSAFDRGGPILLENRGSISDAQLEQYLDDFQTIDRAWQDHMLREVDLCDAYDHRVAQIFANGEVLAYITKQRKADPTYWDGLDELHRVLMASKNSRCR